MSNLLPEAAQKNIRSEYRSRFMLAGASLSMVVAFFTVLALSPSYGVLYMTRPATLVQVTRAQQGKVDADEIAQAQMLLAQLGPVAAATSTVTNAVLDALETRPHGVRIDSIAYVAGQNATISLGGVAESREAMDKYRTSLLQDKRFTTVKLPVGDLISTRGGRFTITLSGKF